MAKLGKKESTDDGKPLIEVFAGDGNPEGVLIETAEGDESPEDFALESETDVSQEDEAIEDAVELDARHMRRNEDKLVAIRPRRTVMHTRIGATWYNFVEGKEQMVPVAVRDWLYEKKVL